MEMHELIDLYIESKAKSWSDATQRSERSRLRALPSVKMLTRPSELWKFLTTERKLKPYAAKTAFIRAGELLDFAMRTNVLKSKQNVLKDWMQENAEIFKKAYKPKAVTLTFDDARARIEAIEDAAVRDKALQLLMTGMRISESFSMNEQGEVTDTKNGDARVVPLGSEYQAKDYDKSADTLRNHLRKIGLTPHTLRKLCATKMAELGARESDLMSMFGWRSSQMASLYVQAQRNKEFADKLKAATTAKKGKDGK